jgi:hypothetical protein
MAECEFHLPKPDVQFLWEQTLNDLVRQRRKDQMLPSGSWLYCRQTANYMELCAPNFAQCGNFMDSMSKFGKIGLMWLRK